MNLRRILCLFGKHTYKLREVHLSEAWGPTVFEACIIEHCDVCKHWGITSPRRQTCFMVSTKYIDDKTLKEFENEQ